MSRVQASEEAVAEKAVQPISVLMVCLGNICRSPTAQAVLEKMLRKRGLATHVTVDSAGTANFHVGKKPDPRTIEAAARRGYELNHLVARQVVASDLELFDYVFAMDRDNLTFLENLRAQVKSTNQRNLGLLLNDAEEGTDTVPDPYYSSDDGFEVVLDLIESGCDRLVNEISSALTKTRARQ